MTTMRAKASRLAVAALAALVAAGQTPTEQSQDRTFYFAYTETVQDIQEIATVIRAMTDIREASVDAAKRAMAVRGTASQIALAEWLFSELDRPARQQSRAQRGQESVKREYRVPGSSDDLVRVFYLLHAETMRELQEIATVIRSTADIRRLFTYNAPRAVTLRGTADQIALAEWLVNELDQPAKQGQHVPLASDEYRVQGSNDDIARVFYLTQAETEQDLQRTASLIRSAANIRRLFMYATPRALVLRGTAHQVALAEQMIRERQAARPR